MKLIKNALISEKDSKLKKVNIAYDSVIAEISEQEINGNFSEVFDIQAALLIPGCIDSHVHFNDPGLEWREDFSTGTKAAAAGGITTIIDMPCTSIPPITNRENLEQKLQKIADKAYIDYAFWGGINGNDIQHENIENLWESGVVGFKIYTISGMESFAALSYNQISELLRKLPNFLYAFHAEDKETIENNLKNVAITSENFAHIRSIEAEFIAVQRILSAANVQNRLHFVHISSKKAAQLIQKEKERISATWETCPHYLHFTASDFPLLRGRLKTAPPVKFAEDREYLRNQVKLGKVDFIATDHAGCDFEKEKNLSDFAEVYNGIPGTQLIIPYLFSEFYNQEKVSLSTLIKLTSENAAKRFGLYPQKGSLQIGTDADFTIIGTDKSYRVNETDLYSKGKYSPFHHKMFSASVLQTIVRGETIYKKEDGIVGKAGFGRWKKRISC